MNLGFWHVYYKVFYPVFFGFLAVKSGSFESPTLTTIFGLSALIAIYKVMPPKKLQGKLK